MPRMPRTFRWIRSIGPDNQRVLVEMYYKGRWKKDCEDGMAGDVKSRPVHLGDGPFTMTVNPNDCEDLPE